MSNDPYQILKVHPSAKLEDIKKAYRELVKIHHPDKGGDAKVILEINAAWEQLKTTHTFYPEVLAINNLCKSKWNEKVKTHVHSIS